MRGDDFTADQYFAGSPLPSKDWLAAELAPDEEIVWAGGPRPGLAFLGALPDTMRNLGIVGFRPFHPPGPADPEIRSARPLFWNNARFGAKNRSRRWI